MSLLKPGSSKVSRLAARFRSPCVQHSVRWPLFFKVSILLFYTASSLFISLLAMYLSVILCSSCFFIWNVYICLIYPPPLLRFQFLQEYLIRPARLIARVQLLSLELRLFMHLSLRYLFIFQVVVSIYCYSLLLDPVCGNIDFLASVSSLNVLRGS